MPSTVAKYFAFAHLTNVNLHVTSALCAGLAERMENMLPDGPEKSAGMRKLLEAKDCFVRSALDMPPINATVIPDKAPGEITMEKVTEAMHKRMDDHTLAHMTGATEVGGVAFSAPVTAATMYEKDGVHTMHTDFGSALVSLKFGRRVTRAGWNAAGMFVYMVPAASYPAQTGAAKAHFGENAMVPYDAYLALKNAQGTISTWVPSVSDCLATDWHEVTP